MAAEEEEGIGGEGSVEGPRKRRGAGPREPKDVGGERPEPKSGVRSETGCWTLGAPSSSPACP